MRTEYVPDTLDPALEASVCDQVEAFVDNFNYKRQHENLGKVTLSEVTFGHDAALLERRKRIKLKTLEARRLHLGHPVTK